MFTTQDRNVQIVAADNGYVVEWTKPFERQSTTGRDNDRHGVSVFRTKKEMLKFIEGFL